MSMLIEDKANLLDVGELEPVNIVVRRRLGKRVDPSTIWRWVQKGVRGGVKLDALYARGCWCTTDAALRDFLQRQTEERTADDSPGERDEVTTRRLKAAGML